MILEAIAQGNPALLYMERYLDEGTKTYSPFAATSEVSPEYRPNSPNPFFDLVTVRVPQNRVSVFLATPSKSLLKHYLRPDEVLFAVHPQTWASKGIERLDALQACPRDRPIRVAPTASTRTVFTFPQSGGPQSGDAPPHFIKLHLPRRISRFNRRFRRKNIENSIALSRDIERVRLDRFAYLPEVLGIAFGEGDDAWGFLVREAAPRPTFRRRHLIPCFALYGGDLNHPGAPPLLVQMIERLGRRPEAFIVDEIMIPVVQSWSNIVREWGILLEPHGQNTLLEVDGEFRPHRIVHRDFDCWVNLEVRRRQGLAVPFVGAGIGADTGRPVDQHYSLVYDRFIGHEFFDYLLEALGRFYPIDRGAIRRRVSEAFHDAFPDFARFFPRRTMFYFSNTTPPGHGFELVDMQQAPEWR
jgi:hypothetical protein